jgi:hypothetical protein
MKGTETSYQQPGLPSQAYEAAMSKAVPSVSVKASDDCSPDFYLTKAPKPIKFLPNSWPTETLMVNDLLI